MSWYFHRDLKPQGPCTLAEMRTKILKGEVGPQDLLFNEEVGEWKAALAWRIFEDNLFPALQGLQPSPGESEVGDWVLLREVQEGPYSTAQLQQMLSSRQISGNHYIWKNGLSGWVQIKDRREFFADSEPSASI